MKNNQELRELIIEELQSNDKNRILKLIDYLKNNDLWDFFNTDNYLNKKIEEIVKISNNSFKLLLLNGYDFNIHFFNGLSIKYFLDKEVLSYYLDETKMNKEYNEFIKIVIDEIIKIPTINSFKYLIDNIIDDIVNKKIEDDFINYKDIGNRICSELRNNTDFNSIFKKLLFINNMQNNLGSDFSILYTTIFNYFNIFHSSNKNEELLKILENRIINLSIKYTENSKIKAKKELTNDFDNWLYYFFVPKDKNNTENFSDEYYEFDKNILDNIKISWITNSLVDAYKLFKEKKVIFNDIKEDVRKFINDNNLIWTLLLLKIIGNKKLTSKGVLKYNLLDLISNMKLLSEIANNELLNISDYRKMELLNNIIKYASIESISILGIDTISKLDDKENYISIDTNGIIDIADLLVTEMAKKSYKTVPFVNGNYYGYHYSIYDTLDEQIILAGIETDACFRIGGFTNDFLHYCALNKNGIVIKITNSNSELLGRASGFRNGNSVYLNQLRMVYDRAYEVKDNDYEKIDIINTLIKACEDIIVSSMQNDNDYIKIEHIFITRSFEMKKMSNNVSYTVTEKIGDDPMINFGEDWYQFINNTRYLFENYKHNYFNTEYGKSSLICLASSKEISDIKTSDIIKKEIDAVYKRKRNKIAITKDIDKFLLRRINRVRGIDAYINNTCLLPLPNTSNLIYIVGDNWYIIFDNYSIIEEAVLDFDLDAKKEFDIVRHLLLENNLDKDIINDKLKVLKK